MRNKVKLKRYLGISLFTTIILLLFLIIGNIYEYRVYTKNLNQKINAIVQKVKEKYPDITDEEIILLLNAKNKKESPFWKEYGINIEKEELLLENQEFYHTFIVLNCLFFLTSIGIILGLFLKYNHEKDKELDNITKYIEEINRKNYYLDINEISEDELSILKNEIYKTTVMLKEAADNSLKDKKDLKKSLEDISHQLKTPLTSILIILDNIIDNPDMDKETRDDFILDIKREVTNINFLVQAILKLSKFDSNTIDFHRQKTSLKQIINKVVRNVSSLCDLRNITIQTTGDPNVEIFCDSKWQVEALTNILKNGIEHSKNGSNIEIKYEQNPVYSFVSIQDHGSGISEKDKKHIFERFYKGEKADPNSIGIGLALSKTIIEEDKGTIQVESDSQGTTFIIKYFNL